MLTTRCPECRTTFRISSTALHQAAGQVRCGRCDAVFDAFESLSDTQRQAKLDVGESRPEDEPEASPSEPPPGEASPSEPPPSEPPPGEASPSEPPPSEPPSSRSPVPEPPESESPAPEPLTDTEEPHTSPETSLGVRVTASPPETWHPAERVQTESGGWRLAAALAFGVLALQVVHHFRASLALTPYVGAWLARAYTLAGTPIPEDVDPADFAIVDWVAAAQDSEDSQPSRLDISTSVRNDSGRALAYPLLSLQLTDRWEKVIGARVFTPEEYLDTPLSGNARIAPGATLSARLELVDPGPDAYGFEVDVCIPVDSQSMRCKSDAVFE